MHTQRQPAAASHRVRIASTLAKLLVLALAAAVWTSTANAQRRERTDKEVVTAVCASCHEQGVNGAPRIGDRAAWTPRMGKGLDALVNSALRGHGQMPARGGMADLSDLEIKSAVVYMFNYDIAALPTPVAQAPTRADPYRQTIAGTDIHLGVVPADALPAQLRQAGAPTGKGYYHLNISLFDSTTKAPISDAQVKLRVADPMGAQTRNLEAITANERVSFGGYFRMPGPEPYTITAQIQRPGVAGVTEAKFQYKVR